MPDIALLMNHLDNLLTNCYIIATIAIQQKKTGGNLYTMVTYIEKKQEQESGIQRG